MGSPLGSSSCSRSASSVASVSTSSLSPRFTVFRETLAVRATRLPLPRCLASPARYCLHCFSFNIIRICWYSCSSVSFSMSTRIPVPPRICQVIYGNSLSAQTEAEIVLRKEELVRYMAWRSPETLKTYEKYFQGRQHYTIQDHVHQSLEEDVANYLKEQEEPPPSMKRQPALPRNDLSPHNHPASAEKEPTQNA